MRSAVLRLSSARWSAWQRAPVQTKLLTPEARDQGYTVVQVPVECREAFLEFVGAMTTYHHLAARRQCPPAVPQAWTQWQTLTQRLVAYLRRLRAGKDGTNPLEELDERTLSLS